MCIRDSCTSATTAIVSALALYDAALLAQTLHLRSEGRDALAQRRVLPLHKTRHRTLFREGVLLLVLILTRRFWTAFVS